MAPALKLSDDVRVCCRLSPAGSTAAVCETALAGDRESRSRKAAQIVPLGIKGFGGGGVSDVESRAARSERGLINEENVIVAECLVGAGSCPPTKGRALPVLPCGSPTVAAPERGIVGVHAAPDLVYSDHSTARGGGAGRQCVLHARGSGSVGELLYISGGSERAQHLDQAERRQRGQRLELLEQD